MKKIYYALGLVSAALSLCGFVSGVASDNKRDTPKEPTEPVVKYEETVSPVKSNVELYQQYHLLILTSIKEAQQAMPDNQQWAYRMMHNAYKYVHLQESLVLTEYQNAFVSLKEMIEPLLVLLKTKNPAPHQLREIDEQLKKVASVVDKEFRYKTVASWIKQ